MQRWRKETLSSPFTSGPEQGTCRWSCYIVGWQKETLLGKGTNTSQENCCHVLLTGTNNPSEFHRLTDFSHSFPAVTAPISFPHDLKMGQHLFLDFPTGFRVQYKLQECEAAFHCLVLVKYEQGNSLIQSV